ncbi:hypothetical protein [Pseudomonas protegens]|uniref:hypothetical protein n=1 Tax=Pseudomonas protegens TaxID=380021 RepID=UPI001F218E7C|nr:hypothetical protein [Pseudomonas protegens]
MTIRTIDVGEEPNDETGDTLRDGGIIINENFAELDTRTAAAQEKAEQGVSDAAAARDAATEAKAVADAAVPATALGDSVPQLINGVVPASQLPSFVDDVLEFPTLEDFPEAGETGKIYIAVNDGDSPTNPTRQYRWSGSAFVVIPASPGSTDQVPEGSANVYFTQARVRATLLTGLGALVNTAILASDSLLQALAKLQGQLNAKLGKSETAADSDKLGGQPAAFYVAPMTGATASTDGAKGLVPAPPAGATVRVLSSLGTWIAQATGGIWGAIGGNLADQADLKAWLDAKANVADLVLSKVYVSPEQIITAGGSLTLNHGLGKQPVLWMRTLICKVADAEYSVDDVIDVYGAVDYAYNYGMMVTANASNIQCQFGNATGAFFVLRKSSRTTVAITPGSWRLVMRVWA